MRIGIHQPHYLPWLRYVQKIDACDLFILLDDADFTKNGWQNRNKIKGPDGWMYLSAPVSAKLGQPICDVQVAQDNWGEKHLRTLRMNYARAPYFEQHVPFLQSIYCRKWTLLRDLNEAMLDYYLREIGITTPVIRSSELGVDGSATERIIALCRKVGGTSYYSGAYAADAYMDTSLFQNAGISLEFQHWKCPEYRQQFPKAGFVPDMAILDLLFNEGPQTLRILREGACGG